MRISLRRAIAALGLCALGTPLVAAEYGYQTPTRLPPVNPSVQPAGYYPAESPYKTATAPQAMPASSAASNIVIHDHTYGSSHASAGYVGSGVHDRLWTDNAACGGGCGPAAGCCEAVCCPWFGSVSGLYMDRDDANEVWLSFDDANIASRTLGTQDAAMDWSEGAEVTFGRYFNGGMNAVEFTYWGIDADTHQATVLAADLVGNLNSALNYNSLAYDDGGGASAVNDWYDDAQVHRLRRDYEFHNIEVNLLGSACNIPLQSNCPCTLNMHWTAGVRYFRLDEDFQFATDDVDDTFTGTVDELYHNINVENNLIGFQLGAGSEYNWSRLSLISDIKFGIYGNYMENHQSVVGGTGVFATIDNVASPYNGSAYNFNGSKTGVSFLGEVDLGMRYRVTSRWSVRAGWRAMAVTGVALSVHQFPDNFNFEDALGAGDVERNGSMILHGGYVGAEYNY